MHFHKCYFTIVIVTTIVAGIHIIVNFHFDTSLAKYSRVFIAKAVPNANLLCTDWEAFFDINQ